MDLIPRDHFFHDAFDLFDTKAFKESNLMKTDIYEQDGIYHVAADLPGFSKENIQVEYQDGYLTIRALKEDSKEDDSKYIRRERYYGEISRSFYVGDIDEQDIKASFQDGILKIQFPKEKEIRKQNHTITID
ncbi:MAG: Hsp20/alpha crystallin family protein [Firmicutes bacterium]|nr:Hsp20/alpha crystallin family protein [Bacillota bacterium]